MAMQNRFAALGAEDSSSAGEDVVEATVGKLAFSRTHHSDRQVPDSQELAEPGGAEWLDVHGGQIESHSLARKHDTSHVFEQQELGHSPMSDQTAARLFDALEAERLVLYSDVKVPFDYYVVVDFECTCEPDGASFLHEIIEFPAVFMNARTLQVDLEFHRYVRPTERPRLSKFCTELTGIEQPTVDAAATLDRALVDFHEFLRERSFVCRRRDRALGRPLFVVCTDGPWDVKKFLRPECLRKGVPLQPYWQRFVDVRKSFAEGFQTGRCGVAKMLERRNLEFEGREHSGIDDSRNIARIAAEVLRAGHRLTC